MNHLLLTVLSLDTSLSLRAQRDDADTISVNHDILSVLTNVESRDL